MATLNRQVLTRSTNVRTKVLKTLQWTLVTLFPDGMDTTVPLQVNGR